MKRVVVTGIGVVSCLGNNQEEVYQSLLNSKSGITFSEEYKEYNLKSNIHGKPNIKLEDYIDRKICCFYPRYYIAIIKNNDHIFVIFTHFFIQKIKITKS